MNSEQKFTSLNFSGRKKEKKTITIDWDAFLELIFYKRTKETWTAFLLRLLQEAKEAAKLRSEVERLREAHKAELKFEDYGDADCHHEKDEERSGVKFSGDSCFYVWRCKKCNLEAYQFIGVREFTFRDVVQEAKRRVDSFF